MKKALIALLILAFVLPLFADDALVLPAKVIRVYATGAYASISKAYDNDGKAQDLSGIKSISFINTGAAVEYGVTDWISAAAQWAPGYNVYSKFDATGMDKTKLADAFDLFVGAKVQIIGAKAPVQNESIRFAIAPGVKFPVTKIDWAKQVINAGNSEDFTVSAVDKHTLGIGGRAYFDYVINEMFFLNLFGEFIYYPTAVKVQTTGLQEYGYVKAVQVGLPTYDPTYKYGYNLTCEFEPHFSTMISEGLQLSAGLPLTYAANPDVTLDGDVMSHFAADKAGYTLTVGPNASLFFQKTFLPIEVKAGYTLPLMGKNNMAMSTMVLQLKAYAKF